MLCATGAVFVKFQQGESAECEALRADAGGPKGRQWERGYCEGAASPLPTS